MGHGSVLMSVLRVLVLHRGFKGLDGFGFQAVSATTMKLEKPDESEAVRVVFQRQHRGLRVRAPISVEILNTQFQNAKVLCATTAR